MNELEKQVRREMEAANTAKAILNAGTTSENDDRTKQLAEQLRDMIKEGLSDECSICLSEFTQPVITPCAHIYCRYVKNPDYRSCVLVYFHPPPPKYTIPNFENC